MAGQGFGFDDEPHRGITPYVVWTIVGCMALGAFLYADGYFDEIIEEVIEGSASPTTVDLGRRTPAATRSLRTIHLVPKMNAR